MRVYECRYVRREDPGDLVWGFYWRPAVVVVEEGRDDAFPFVGLTLGEIEERMYDKETGRNVGDTYNFCIDPCCTHEDCAPLTQIY